MRFNNLEGNKKIDLINDNKPSTAKPKIRKGNNSSHTIGYSTSARIAKGAQTTNKTSQSKKVIILKYILGFSFKAEVYKLDTAYFIAHNFHLMFEVALKYIVKQEN